MNSLSDQRRVVNRDAGGRTPDRMYLWWWSEHAFSFSNWILNQWWCCIHIQTSCFGFFENLSYFCFLSVCLPLHVNFLFQPFCCLSVLLIIWRRSPLPRICRITAVTRFWKRCVSQPFCILGLPARCHSTEYCWSRATILLLPRSTTSSSKLPNMSSTTVAFFREYIIQETNSSGIAPAGVGVNFRYPLYCRANSKTYHEGPIFSLQFCSSPQVMEQVCDSLKNSTYVWFCLHVFIFSICVLRRRRWTLCLGWNSSSRLFYLYPSCFLLTNPFFYITVYTFAFFTGALLKLYMTRAMSTSVDPMRKFPVNLKPNTNLDSDC